jgi:hypothetical protein
MKAKMKKITLSEETLGVFLVLFGVTQVLGFAWEFYRDKPFDSIFATLGILFMAICAFAVMQAYRRPPDRIRQITTGIVYSLLILLLILNLFDSIFSGHTVLLWYAQLASKSALFFLGVHLWLHSKNMPGNSGPR